MKVIYINYNDFTKKNNSASVVRPKAILDAMLQMNIDVQMLSGELNRKFAQDRKKLVESFSNNIKDDDFDFCYIEGLTKSFYKLYNRCDVKLIKQIYKMNIPIGVFYRDVYWKFNQAVGIRDFVYNIMQKWELRFYKKYCKKIFVPSLEMGKYLKTDKIVALPPACFDVVTDKNKNKLENTAIYVGAINKKMGTLLMLEAFKQVNLEKKINLILICRENERKIINDFLAQNGLQSWLIVASASANDLNEYYAKSDFAIIPRKKDVYVDFAMPVKLFEYISYCKPIVTTNCTEVANFVTKNDIGIVCEDTVLSLKNAILFMSNNYQNYNLESCCKENQWKDRIETIINELK